ncbi:MAG: ATP-binding protein, partial [Deltaproteobacteria bacterium]|nr:ATP-binding protein [Deltaproteobacteria bacterium]
MKMLYKSRWITRHLIDAIEFSPVLVLSGARQTGKSTLLQNEAPFKDWSYVTLDDYDACELATKNPKELLGLHDRMVIDEAQKAPQLLSAIKQHVDRDRSKRFVLSGSAHLLLMKNVTETLAGRCLYFDLLPFSLGEEKGVAVPGLFDDMLRGQAGKPPAEVQSVSDFHLFRGFLPPVTYLDTEAHIAQWWSGYIRTYLERDLRDLSQIAGLADFRRVMTMLAARSAQICNQADIARSARISQATVSRYINLLEVSGLFATLQPYSKNITKRIVKTPKIYCIDTGLLCSLAGIGQSERIDSTLRGQIFESLVFQNLMALASARGGQLYYLRKQGGI